MLPSRIRTKIFVGFYIISAIPLIGFLLIYFQFREQNELTNQIIERQQPIALGWVQLLNGINHSIAAQRGWVLFGTDSFLKERQQIWENEILPMRDKLEALNRDRWERVEEEKRFYNIRLQLLELKQFQDEIEKIANSPENFPAQQIFIEKLKPSLNTINENLKKILDLESSKSKKNRQFIQTLIELQGTIWSSIASLHIYVLDGENGDWEQFRQNWINNERLLLDIQGMDAQLNAKQQSYFRQLLKNREQVNSLSDHLFQARNQEDWNISQYKMAHEVIPLVKDIEESIQLIVQWHSDSGQASNQYLREQFEQWRIYLLLVSLIIFLTGLLLSFFLGRRVVIPLQELRDAVRYVKNEDFYGHIEVTTQDEVGELAQEFEEMLVAIRERTKDANRGRQILENSPFPVMFATLDRELLYLNPAAFREFKRLTDFIPVKPEHMLGKGIDFLLESTNIEPRQLSTPYNLPPSTDISIGDQIIEITFSPLFDEENQYLGPVLHWKNATQERLNQKSRAELVTKLEAEGRSQGKMLEQLEQQNETLLEQVELDSASSAIAEAINSLDVGEILKAALKTLVHTTNSQLGILYLYNIEEEELQMRDHYTVDNNVLKDEFYEVKGLPHHIFKTKESSIIRFPPNKPGHSFHLGSIKEFPAMIVGYPLVFQKKCLGVLLLSSVSPFSDAFLRFIENAAPQLAVSIQNAMTFQTVQAQQEILKAANLELEAATQMKSEFLASMSHELRTPLNAIIGFAETLLDIDEENPLTDYQHDRLRRVFKSGKHLLELINSILDLSKIEARKMQINIFSFNLEELLKEVLGLMEALVANKEIKLKLDIKDALVDCRSDQDKFRQIMINLLGNAIKFTERGSISVIASLKDDSVQIDVKDTGCGIPDSQLGTIFGTFQQVDGSETKHHEGTGLGLALVKSMSRLLGGDVAVVSELGVGSIFTVTLPLHLDLPASIGLEA